MTEETDLDVKKFNDFLDQVFKCSSEFLQDGLNDLKQILGEENMKRALELPPDRELTVETIRIAMQVEFELLGGERKYVLDYEQRKALAVNKVEAVLIRAISKEAESLEAVEIRKRIKDVFSPFKVIHEENREAERAAAIKQGRADGEGGEGNNVIPFVREFPKKPN